MLPAPQPPVRAEQFKIPKTCYVSRARARTPTQTRRRYHCKLNIDSPVGHLPPEDVRTMRVGAPSLLPDAAITERLTQFLSNSRWEDIPDSVRHEAKRSLINFFATAIAGSNDPAIDKTLRVLSPFSGAASCRIIGRLERSDMLVAAMINSMSANVFDFDDTHERTVIHPTAPVAAAIFALADTMLLSGPQLVHALVLGMEIECRIGNAVSPSHYQRGWHITSTCGVFGSATAASKLLCLDANGLREALGAASVQAAGLVESLGSMAKSISVGNAARNGLLSALLAQNGLTGPDRPLEGQRGFLRVTSDDPDFGAILKGLGQEWEILTNTYKPYPCGVVLNPVIEGCMRIQKDPTLRINGIQSVQLTGHPLLRERTDRLTVRTGREAQVSAQHAVAVALTHGRAGLEEFSDDAANDRTLDFLRQKVSFVDNSLYTLNSASVRVVQADGNIISCDVRDARGSRTNPLSDEDLQQKLARLAEYALFRSNTDSLAAAIWNVDQSQDVSALLGLAAAGVAP